MREYEKFMKKPYREKVLQNLKGILEGIISDSKIEVNETGEIHKWRFCHQNLKKYAPFNQLFDKIDDALLDGFLTVEEVEDILYVCNAYQPGNQYYDYITHSIQQLHGIIRGIMCDDSISKEELDQLRFWLDDNSDLEGTFPYDEVYSLLYKVLEDGIVSQEEEAILKVLFSDFVDSDESYAIDKAKIAELKSELSIGGICALAPEVNVDGNRFCLTGESTKMTRKEISSLIEENGGIFSNGVTKKTNYLVVGGDGNTCWAFSCYGRKIEKAMELRKSGTPIIIIHEVDFWDALN